MDKVTFYFNWKGKPREADYRKDKDQTITVVIRDKELAHAFTNKLTYGWDEQMKRYYPPDMGPGFLDILAIISNALNEKAGEKIATIRQP